MRISRAVYSLLVVALTALTARAADPPPAETTFEKHVLPILQARCHKCHSGDQPKAGLRLDAKASLLRGGRSGPAIAVGAAESSRLWELIVADKMPPAGESNRVTKEEKSLIRAWINAGAKAEDAAAVASAAADERIDDDSLWSLKRPVRPAVPQVRTAARVRNPIDAFIVAALEKKDLKLSPEADRPTLLRRVCYDLLGLPPTPAQLDEFLADTADDAYERLVDRLLANPHYGERWARHWLDVAGYADSEGILDADYVRTAAWRYRDYVIAAFNADKPYDRFVQEQLAGDELVDYWAAHASGDKLPPQVIEGLVATGFLRCASDTSRPDFANIKNAPGYYYQTLDDTLKIVGTSLLGITVQCARCHSHKYDPISQTDYYRLQAVFMSAYRPGQWVPQVQRRLLEATAVQEAKAKEHNGKLDAAITAIRKELAELQAKFGQQRFDELLARLPEAIREDVRAALAADAKKRTEVQKYLTEKFQKELRPDAATLAKLLAEKYPEYKPAADKFEAAIKAEEAQRINFPEIRALYDLPGEAPTPVLLRGDYRTPGAAVLPGVPNAWTPAAAFAWSPPAQESKTSGRRLALARWITQADHPLTARVLVNRLWLHHFGVGLVATADDFGNTGSGPSHDELLDWLATELPTAGWSIKHLHRLMLTSSTYRQQSWFDPKAHEAAARIDPDNRLLWRQRLRRLEAEAVRDAVLTVSGSLNVQMFGAPVPMQRRGDGEVVAPAGPEGLRRSIYLQVRRSQPLTLLQVFDQPVMETNCALRGQSTVSSQALALLNSDFLITQAEALSARAQKEDPDAPERRAVRLAFSRVAGDAEYARLKAFVADQTKLQLAAVNDGKAPLMAEQTTTAQRRALTDLCHMLLSANEFVYID